MKHFKRDKGFTMVELIIVVAIIAVLAAILAPQYLKYVEQSKETSDLRTATNIVRAATVAIADSSNRIPPGYFVEVLWITGTESGAHAKRGQVMVRTQSNTPSRVSVYNVYGSTYDVAPLPLDFDLEPFATNLISILNADNQDIQYGREHIADFATGQSRLANEGNFAFHINTTSGEVALAKLVSVQNGTEIANKWVDLGLPVIPAP